MGNNKQALQLIIQEENDVKKVITDNSCHCGGTTLKCYWTFKVDFLSLDVVYFFKSDDLNS